MPGKTVTKDMAAGPVVARCAAAAASCAQGHRLNEQLAGAPTSRVVTEQGKNGDLRARRADRAEAFSRLRTYARNTNIRLTDVAEGRPRRPVPADGEPSTWTAWRSAVSGGACGPLLRRAGSGLGLGQRVTGCLQDLLRDLVP